MNNNEQYKWTIKSSFENFNQISVSLCLKAKRVPSAHRGAVLDEIQDINTTEFEHVL